MITLDYKLSSDWRPFEIDLRTADEMTLRFDAFPGDVVFRVGAVDLSAQWGWVPVLDFALALETIAQRLANHRHELFEFTESGATIDFRQNGDDAVTISPSYTQRSAQIERAQLERAATTFADRVCEELGARHPALAENAFFSELSAPG